jgi:pimeloyl-ACP methyl ester carboxylesterase
MVNDNSAASVATASVATAQAPPPAQPENLVQRRLLRLWEGVLSRTDFGIDDEFFKLGGDEEAAERMFAAISNVWGPPLTMADINGAFTVRYVAAELTRRLEREAENEGTPLPFAAGAVKTSRPHHPLHDQLLGVWETLLGRSDIGIEDDFMALGGNPVLASRMAREVEALCGEPVSLAACGDNVTVRALSDQLLLRLPQSLFVPVQLGMPEVAPLFILHGDFGSGGYYVREIARQLGPERPVYAVAPHGSLGDELPGSIEEMAADCVRRVVEVGPHGPLHLAGLCIGVLIAWNMAQLLSRQGREVVSLTLFDPGIGTGNDDSVLPPPRLSARAKQIPRVRKAWLMAEYRALAAAHHCQPYAGKVSVLWAGEGDRRDSPERCAGLKALAPRVEMSVCPGDHNTAMGRHVGGLAAEMKRILTAR